jgi:RNA polymerase sigma factor (sigma-70 family)
MPHPHDPGRFPETRRSIVLAARSDDVVVRRDALEALVAAYWKPVYKYLRLRWSASGEEAEDLTQTFFTLAMEKRFFDRFEPAKARFRTFLRVCLDGFVANERKAARRLKRGGAHVLVALDFETAEGELRRHEAADETDLDECFHREWVRSLFGLAVEDLRAQCAARGRPRDFELFRRYDLEGGDAPGGRPTYGALAAELGTTVTDVTNRLAAARRELRRLVLERLRGICGSDGEFEDEAKVLLGITPR